MSCRLDSAVDVTGANNMTGLPYEKPIEPYWIFDVAQPMVMGILVGDAGATISFQHLRTETGKHNPLDTRRHR